MPTEPNSVILRSFISACKHDGHIPCAEENIREILLKIELDLGSNYVLAFSLSCLFGYCSDANNLRSAMKAKGIKKYPGSSSVQSLDSPSEGKEAIQITGMKALLHAKDERTLSMSIMPSYWTSWDQLYESPISILPYLGPFFSILVNIGILFRSWDALKVAPQHGLKLWLKTMRHSHGETNSKSFMNVKTQVMDDMPASR
ncbi:hypothetical protein H5410_001923 [Solanum commersonii]|uniref:Pentatricopeptide repeat-containing protein n=1 Tax=Solanum commersonii TaxID=4109 RepID=A0A9J6B0E9_SOLCO|nr:hypothetical protein H5410_001923 [Solanum commersonii]